MTHDTTLIGEISRVLKPGGRLVVREAGDEIQLTKNLSVCGFSCSEAKAINDDSGDSMTVSEISCQKPSFEVIFHLYQ
jgi:ubiquinone/menaquinone biosynthesis C-methylase UbiE